MHDYFIGLLDDIINDLIINLLLHHQLSYHLTANSLANVSIHPSSILKWKDQVSSLQGL